MRKLKFRKIKNKTGFSYSEPTMERLLAKKAKEDINKLASVSLLPPFAKMNSTPRLDMAANAFKHAIVPYNPETPRIDSSYANDILLSTENKKVSGGVRLLYAIPKIINDYLCETTYIYESLESGEIKLIVVPRSEACYQFGYPTTSEFEGHKPGDVLHGDVFIKHFSHMDPDTDIKAYGKNLRIVYTDDENIGEDAIIISDELAENMSVPFQRTVEINVSPDFVMRNLYGDRENYQPIPLPGQSIKDGLLAAMFADDSKSFLAYDADTILDSDVRYIIQEEDAEIIDIEIFSKDPIAIPVLDRVRNEYRAYLSKVSQAIIEIKSRYSRENIHFSLDDIFNKYSMILNSSELRRGMVEIKNNIVIKITTFKYIPLQTGYKLTNRYGGKGTVSKVVPRDSMFITFKGQKLHVHALINVTGTFNRENMGQFYEIGLSGLWYHVQHYLNNSNDSYEEKKNVILAWLERAMQQTTVEVLEEVPAKELVEYYKRNMMYLTYKPYDDPEEPEFMNYDVFENLVGFTKTISDIERGYVFSYEGYVSSHKHFFGDVFYMVLANGPFKDTSIRGTDGTNAKGNPTKIAKDRKAHQTRYNSKALKQSDFATNILINPIFHSDKRILKNNTEPLHNHLNAMGHELVIIEDDNKEE